MTQAYARNVDGVEEEERREPRRVRRGDETPVKAPRPMPRFITTRCMAKADGR